MADYSILSSQDRTQIQEMLSWYHRVVQNARNRPDQRPEGSSAPEVYSCFADTGIPAMVDPGVGTSDPSPGTSPDVNAADCTVCRVFDDDLVQLGFKVQVWNLSTTAVSAGTFGLAVRDKFGNYVFVQAGVGSGGGGGGGFGTQSYATAGSSSPQSLPVATKTLVALTVIADTDGYWDSVNGQFVIPTGFSGYYMVGLSLGVDTAFVGNRIITIEDDSNHAYVGQSSTDVNNPALLAVTTFGFFGQGSKLLPYIQTSNSTEETTGTVFFPTSFWIKRMG